MHDRRLSVLRYLPTQFRDSARSKLMDADHHALDLVVDRRHAPPPPYRDGVGVGVRDGNGGRDGRRDRGQGRDGRRGRGQGRDGDGAAGSREGGFLLPTRQTS